MRFATINRITKETNISLSINLDGGDININTGIGFFDHMLEAFAMHGSFGLEVKAEGDLRVDAHHTVEDVGIVLGQAFAKALGKRKGISRFGHFFTPMDEALAFSAVDISGRPFLRFAAEFSTEKIGLYDTCLTEEFMRAFATNGGVTLHVRCEYGTNDHHITEAIFKSFAHSLRIAVEPVEGLKYLSTKGTL